MRKFILSNICLIFLGYGLFAQTKLGLKFSPAFTSSRVNMISDTVQINGNGSAFRFSLGLVVDHPLTETYYISTGLFYVPKQVSFRVQPDPGFSYKNESESYNLQYLQIPVTLKLYTNELVPSMALYFQVGGALDINVFDEPMAREYTLIREFRTLDSSVILGMGGEYRVGINTILFLGFSYQRGLGNVVKTTNPQLEDGFAIRNTVAMLDFGIKF